MGVPSFSIDVASVDIKPGRMVVTMCVNGAHTTSSSLAQRVLTDRPHLAFHACRNDAGPTFGAVMAHTSLPHLLEHVIIDEQVRAEAEGSDRTFVGNTQWIDESEGMARVEVSFGSDLVALTALRAALAYLEGLGR